MHILLTDLLSCPRCGPEFGLVLLAEVMRERRVESGKLGCPNCRELYPLRGGVADLTAGSTALPGETAFTGDGSPAADPGEAGGAGVRSAALLGLAEASGSVLLVGGAARVAAELAALLPQVEVVTLGGEGSAPAAREGVSPLLGGVPFPFRDRSLRGVALQGEVDPPLLREALRTLHPGARLLLEAAPAGSSAVLAELGAQLLLDQEGTVVARAPGQPVQLRVNALR